MTLLATIDRLAEQLEQTGHKALAAVLDTVSQELDERTAENQDEDEEAVTASTHAAGDATRVLTSSGARIFDAVKQYGAKNYAVTGDGLRITLDRGDVQTETVFGFYSQDEAGRPQLRVTFTCGSDRMVRWASLDNVTPDALVQAATHVFGTGENYGARVVTAATWELPELSQQQRAENWLRDLFGSYGGSISDKDLKAKMKSFEGAYGKDAIKSALAGLKKEKYIAKKGQKWQWQGMLPTASARLELIDAIEQRVHDEVVGHVCANVQRALRPYSKRKIQAALPLLDAWTARHVTRYLRAS